MMTPNDYCDPFSFFYSALTPGSNVWFEVLNGLVKFNLQRK